MIPLAGGFLVARCSMLETQPPKAALSQELASSAAFCAALMTWVASCSITCQREEAQRPNISGRLPALARPARSEFSRFTLSVLSIVPSSESPHKSAVMLPGRPANTCSTKFVTDCRSSGCFRIFWCTHAPESGASSRRCCVVASAELQQSYCCRFVRTSPRSEPLERDFPAFEGRQIRLVRA